MPELARLKLIWFAIIFPFCLGCRHVRSKAEAMVSTSTLMPMPSVQPT